MPETSNSLFVFVLCFVSLHLFKCSHFNCYVLYKSPILYLLICISELKKVAPFVWIVLLFASFVVQPSNSLLHHNRRNRDDTIGEMLSAGIVIKLLQDEGQQCVHHHHHFPTAFFMHGWRRSSDHRAGLTSGWWHAASKKAPNHQVHS